MLAALLLLASVFVSSNASGVTLAWDPSAGVVAGYRLYQGGSSGFYTNVVNVGTTTSNTVAGLVGGRTYFFAVTAYDSNNLESDYSNEISYTVPATNTTPPTIALTAPVNGASYAAPATVNLAASVTANGHTITAVQFYNGATLLGQDSAAPYSFTWSNVGAGTYNLTARLVYDSGSTLNSSPVSVTAVSGSGTTHLDFTYADRASLLAGGWDFLARTASGAARNTEQTSGMLPNYDQATHPGVLRTPADVGDLWKAANDTRNSLFRNLPVDWTSIRLKVSFAPTQNYQQASLVAYQDDDNYVQVTREFNSGNKVTLVQETAGSPVSLPSASVSATSNLYLRLDRSATSGTFSGYYSLDGTTWIALGNVTQTLNNPRLGIVVGSSPGGYPNADLAWVEVMTPQTTPPPAITLTAPAKGASYTAPATIACAASVVPNGHTITSVRFYSGTTLLGQDATAPYTWTWGNVSPGSYSVTAQAVYDAGSTASSSPVSVAVVSPPDVTGNALPAPWQSVDIGSISAAGSASATGGVYTVSGAGTLSGTADSLRFMYQPLTADGEIRARLAAAETATNGMAGVMIRESLTAGSRYAFMGFTGKNVYRWQRRSSTGGSTAATTSGTDIPTNAWVRLVRTGNSITGYKSSTGTNWTRVTSRSISMATNLYVGLAVVSGSSNTLNTARFNSISVVP